MSQPEPVIVAAVRTPMGKGKPGGALSEVHPVDLLAHTFRALIERTGIDPDEVDDVLTGCVGQVREQAGTPGRQAWLAAGYPEHVPAVTIERKCGSGQQAIDFAAYGIRSGAYDIVIASGVESMSRVPMGSNYQDADPFGPRVRARFPRLAPQGICAELVALKWQFTREQLDVYSVESHKRAAAAADSGGFSDEIVPIPLPDGRVVTADETIRRNTNVEKLSQLEPAFDNPKYRERFPEITEWKITAGNSSQITDGAAAVLMMSEKRANSLGLTPLARIVSSVAVGDDPHLMLTGPIPATRKVLERTGMRMDQIDAVEVNEAFAPVPLAWLDSFPEVDPARLNPRGGAIALGHPLGASGVRLMTTLINHLRQTHGRYGLQTMCEAGGMANATIIERLG